MVGLWYILFVKQLLIPPQAEQPSRQSSHLFQLATLAGCYPPYWATGRASWLRHPAYQEGECVIFDQNMTGSTHAIPPQVANMGKVILYTTPLPKCRYRVVSHTHVVCLRGQNRNFN